MAVSYVNRKCESCGGRKFDYNKKSKTWACLYCGAITEREEKYDGLFTIKNVVRQALRDVAFRRLDSAEKNIIECEKIDSKYIGTIIANICFLMVKATAPGEADVQDIRNIIAKIKKYNNILQAEHSVVTDDEEILYEFFECPNVYATLLLVYDSINDKKRCELVEQFINLADIDSKETNKNLLSYSLKNQRFEMFDEVIKNNNTDKRFALTEVLSKYPDNEKKTANAALLLSQGAFTKEDKGAAEGYFTESPDSVQTKSQIFVHMTVPQLKISTNVVIQSLLDKTGDVDIAKSIFTKLCSSKLSDEDVYSVLSYCFCCKNIDIALAGLTVLKDSEQYVVLEQKLVVSLFTRKDISADDKLLILNKAYSFNLNGKQRDAIVHNYLCFNQDGMDDRKKILPFLLDTVETVPTNTFEHYILKCSTDGAYKAQVVQSVLNKDINISFFHNLLARYILSVVDDKETKKEIIISLIKKGIKLDPKSFGDYVCFSADDPAIKAQIVKMLQDNGCQLKSDTLNNYLTGLTDFEQFNPDLFILLIGDAHVFTDAAMKNYLLLCKDRDAFKAKNAEVLSKKLATPFGTAACTIKHLDNTIECNMLQAYILATNDMYEVANEIVAIMLASKAKLNAQIKINGASEKLKKYVLARKDDLSDVTAKLCDTHKVYKGLF